MSPPENKAFYNAYTQFLDSIPEAERIKYAPVASAQDLVDGIRKLDFLLQRHQSTRLGRTLKCIDKLSARLNPFFATIDTFVSSNPEYAAIVWGFLKFVLQLAGSFANFFDRLVAVLNQVADAFPRYEEILRLYTGPKSGRMRAHLEGIYRDVLEFFQHVVRIFTKVDGRFKSRPAIFCDIIWTPFNVRFEKFLANLQAHADFVQNELLLLHAIAINDTESAAAHERHIAAEERRLAAQARERLEDVSRQTDRLAHVLNDQKKDQMYKNILYWINPPRYVELLEKSQSLREEGTCSWLSSQDAFIRWQEVSSVREVTNNKCNLDPRLLWVNGLPGAGKTVLASYILKDLLQPTCNGTSCCYYFFTTDDESKAPAAAYRSIAAQMLRHGSHNEAILDKFLFIKDQGMGQLFASPLQLLELVRICCYELGGLTILLDGVDECSETKDLFKTVQWLMEVSPVKILLLSRPGLPELQDTIAARQRIVMDKHVNSDDIRVFLCACLDEMVHRNRLEACDTSSLADRLVYGANGMFLWASLMMNHLLSPLLTPKERLVIMEQVTRPEGIEELYDRILTHISASRKFEKAAAKKVFSWLTYSKTVVWLSQLYDDIKGEYAYEEVETPRGSSSLLQSHDPLTQFQETLQSVCGSLLEFSGYKSASVPPIGGGILSGGVHIIVRFVHVSVKEYFESFEDDHTMQCNRDLIPGRTEAHMGFAQSCLRILLAKRRKPAYDSLVSYAVRHWVDHLVDLTKHGLGRKPSHPDKALAELMAAVSEFLNRAYDVTAWLVSFYTLHSDDSTPLPADGFEKWTYWLQSLHMTEYPELAAGFAAQCARFFVMLRRLDDIWGSKLRGSPTLMWQEVALFMKSEFLFSKSDSQMTLLKPRALADARRSSKALCEVSASSLDGAHCFVLSVWPCREYEARWFTIGAQKPLEDWKDVCKSWLVRYEMWNVSTKESLGEIRIPLDEDEVWLQMRQSLYEQSRGEWKTAFPVAIGPDGRSAVILRTLYTFRKEHQTSPLTWRKCVIALDFDDNMTRHWDKTKTSFDPNDPRICGRPLQHIHRDRYTYEFVFSPNGRYLAFDDLLRAGYPIYQQHVAIYEISRTNTLTVKRVALKTMALNFPRDRAKTSFHPFRDMMAIWFGNRVEAWDFGRDAQGSSLLRVGKLSGSSTAGSLEMSECGEYAVVNRCSGPTVFKIPELSTAGTTASKREYQHPAPRASPRHMSLFGLRNDQILGNASVVSAGEGAVSSVAYIQSGDSPSLRLVSNTSGLATQSVELISLPATFQAQHTAPAVMALNAENTHIRIVLNAVSHSEYSLSAQDAGVVPAVIDRSVRSLTVTTSASQSVMGATAVDEEADDDTACDWSTVLPDPKHIEPVLLGHWCNANCQCATDRPFETAPEAHRLAHEAEPDDDHPAKRPRRTWE